MISTHPLLPKLRQLNLSGMLNTLDLRVEQAILARLAYVCAMFNVLLSLFHQLHPDADPFKMNIAEFSL